MKIHSNFTDLFVRGGRELSPAEPHGACDAARRPTLAPSDAPAPRGNSSSFSQARPRVGLQSLLRFGRAGPKTTLDEAGFLDNKKLAVEIPANRLGPGGQVSLRDLHMMVKTVGTSKRADINAGRGVSMNGLAAAWQLFGATLALAAPRSRDPSRVASVAHAIRTAEPLVIRSRFDPAAGPRNEITLGSNPMDLTARIMDLPVGEHTYLPVSRQTPGGAHQVGIGISRTDASHFTVSLIDTLKSQPAVKVTVGDGKLLPALASLFSGQFFESAPNDEKFCPPGDDRLLKRWLGDIDP